ncbi:MAG: type II toxin-antitoxin system VapB family antitoxin [Treponema sp.]|nr:type II toxin-antitoxin system VapB family antitoxin [Treponema sp.]
MQTANIFANGENQAVNLPHEYQFAGENVYIKKIGEAVILFPADKEWEVFLHGLNNFSDDFMSEGRLQGEDQGRESF